MDDGALLLTVAAHLGLAVFFVALVYLIATGAPWKWGRDLRGTYKKAARYALIWTIADTAWDVWMWVRYFRGHS
jgi:hypothetical protein